MEATPEVHVSSGTFSDSAIFRGDLPLDGAACLEIAAEIEFVENALTFIRGGSYFPLIFHPIPNSHTPSQRDVCIKLERFG